MRVNQLIEPLKAILDAGEISLVTAVDLSYLDKKEQEIRNMVMILKQIDLPDILLLARDANTLLMRQKESENISILGGGEIKNASVRGCSG